MKTIKFDEKDYLEGVIEELRVLPVIQTYFKDKNIKRVVNQYSPFDFSNGTDLNFELKGNNKNIDCFTTCIISINKLRVYHGKRLMLLFSFKTDDNNNRRLFFIEYSKERFDEFERKDIYIQKRNITNRVILIPTNYLIEIIV